MTRCSLKQTCQLPLVCSLAVALLHKKGPCHRRKIYANSLWLYSYCTQTTPSRNKNKNYIFIYIRVFRCLSSGAIYYVDTSIRRVEYYIKKSKKKKRLMAVTRNNTKRTTITRKQKWEEGDFIDVSNKKHAKSPERSLGHGWEMGNFGEHPNHYTTKNVRTVIRFCQWTKNVVEHDIDDDNNCRLCTWNDTQQMGKVIVTVGNRRENHDNSNESIAEMSQYTNKSPRESRWLGVTQTLLKDNQLTLKWKACKKRIKDSDTNKNIKPECRNAIWCRKCALVLMGKTPNNSRNEESIITLREK